MPELSNFKIDQKSGSTITIHDQQYFKKISEILQPGNNISKCNFWLLRWEKITINLTFLSTVINVHSVLYNIQNTAKKYIYTKLLSARNNYTYNDAQKSGGKICQKSRHLSTIDWHLAGCLITKKTLKNENNSG